MSWVKAAAELKPESVKMEELIKQMVQSNLQQQQALQAQRQANAQQQETNRLLAEQMAALRDGMAAQPVRYAAEQDSVARKRV